MKEEYIQLICNPYGDDSSVNTRVTIDIMDRDISRDELIEVLAMCSYMGGGPSITFSTKALEAFDQLSSKN